MEIRFGEKSSYLITFLLLIGIVTVGVGARIDMTKSYHMLQNILDQDGDSVDLDNNGIIDYADQAIDVDWELVDLHPICEREDEFAIGLSDNALICSRIYLDCSSGSCNLTYSDEVPHVEQVSSEDFRPKYIDVYHNQIYATSNPEQGEGRMVPYFAKFNMDGLSFFKDIYEPRQISVNEGYVHITSVNGLFVTNGPKCYMVDVFEDSYGVYADSQAIYVADYGQDRIFKYDLGLLYQSSVIVSNPIYLLAGRLNDLRYLVAISADKKIYFITPNLTVINHQDLDFDVSSMTIYNDKAYMVGNENGINVLKMGLLSKQNSMIEIQNIQNLWELDSGINDISIDDGILYVTRTDNIQRYDLTRNIFLHNLTLDRFEGIRYDECTNKYSCGGQLPENYLKKGMAYANKSMNWTLTDNSTPSDCEFTCENTYNEEFNVCGKVWAFPPSGVIKGNNENCSAGLPNYTMVDVKGEFCNPAQEEIKYCYACNPDNTSCEFNRYICI